MPVRSFIWTTSAALVLAVAAPCAAQPASTPAQPGGGAIEAEVRSNILRQRIGSHTVADLNLPDEFLARVTDRIIRASYEQRYRLVVRDAQAAKLSPINSGVDSTNRNEGSSSAGALSSDASVAKTDHGLTPWIILGAVIVAIAASAWAIVRRLRGAA